MYPGQSATYQGLISNQFPSQPQEGFLEVVVRFGRDVVVLKIFLAVECDGFGLDLALLHINLVPTEHDRDVLANADEITCLDQYRRLKRLSE